MSSETVTTDAFERWVCSLRLGRSVDLSPSGLADKLGITVSELAELTGVHRNTVTMAPRSPRLQRAMRDVLRVLSAAYALTDDVDRALFWFRNQPIADLGHCTAIDLVALGRAQAVIDYVESLSAGPAG